MRRSFRLKLWKIDLNASEFENSGIETYLELIGWIVEQYGRRTGKTSTRFWIDHTPLNLQYAGILMKMFPNAKFIHMLRDGRAVASSLIPLDWGPNTVFKAARWWIEKVSYGLGAESYFGDDVVCRVKYEDLVSSPVQILKHICSHLGINYDVNMLRANGFKVPSYTSKQHALIGSEMKPDRIDRWKNELTPREIEIFEGETSDLLYFLDYSLIFNSRARRINKRETR